jgi:hypothetical protein
MTKHVFLSFVEEDLTMVNLFRGQAKNWNSDLAFDDYSVKIPYTSDNAAYIRTQIKEKIRSASVTICLLGTDTSKSTWVDWELETSYALGNRVLGVRLYANLVCPTPNAISSRGGSVLGWDIEAIVKAIG